MFISGRHLALEEISAARLVPAIHVFNRLDLANKRRGRPGQARPRGAYGSICRGRAYYERSRSRIAVRIRRGIPALQANLMRQVAGRPHAAEIAGELEAGIGPAVGLPP